MEAVLIILWLLCSVICYQIMKSKGYPNDTCLKHGIGGFFLGLIWVIVDLCKESYAAQQVQVAQQPVLNAPVEQMVRLQITQCRCLSSWVSWPNSRITVCSQRLNLRQRKPKC